MPPKAKDHEGKKREDDAIDVLLKPMEEMHVSSTSFIDPLSEQMRMPLPSCTWRKDRKKAFRSRSYRLL